ncbi:MAG: MFS transporter [Kangiella sp.]|nr:MAG: MFS transporter [Kangiella sp.]
MNDTKTLSEEIKQYALITANYWAFTLTDGALRMLVLLYFYQLGYSPFQLASLFVFYELFGVITNLIGGWLGASFGLNKTMNIGLGLQVLALALLLVSPQLLTVVWVMSAQAISGIAKDLNKMSAKSAIKTLVPKDQKGQLFKWVAILTGSKNTLKGVGFFLGGFLLTQFGFHNTILIMLVLLTFVWIMSLIYLKRDLGKSKRKPKFSQIFSKNKSINFLSGARLFLFSARDVWFVIALPVYLSEKFEWTHTAIGTFMALWIIGYGFVQTLSPQLFKKSINLRETSISQMAGKWALLLSLFPLLISFSLGFDSYSEILLLIGLGLFGVIFAINSSVHSFLIVDIASEKSVSMDVGFYYMANAMGRLLGTILSGYLYQKYGLETCLIFSSGFLLIASGLVWRIKGK